ncbi:acyl-CoA ligase (AMP-forming), exosortase A system-associated [Microbacterium sp. zg-YB36]|uniref:acyl-CoA ligase (AMP-forming), exosortase A system-associated n=1 Tax=Microbacterium sp. zg-YB36 TaxID=2969407 RepID=UPI00214A970E|nr:acyl-CoA ligase (AMP-forming), exosortase A system-associated [Microbacterium sp. zg-YB36]MDL5352367.1 acyl-CoA ligase (AMP-forming), exosortase A system-associated [Microbacterium sp. zg-YB36]
MIRTNFHHLLSSAAAAMPDFPALTYKGETVTYAEAWQRAEGATARLMALGIGQGDRVAIYLEKRIETVIAMVAVSAAGGIFVPINHVLKAPQVEHILVDSGARMLVTSADRLSQLSEALAASVIEDVIVVGGAPPHLRQVAVHRWQEDAAVATPITAAIDVDPAAILYTSGSTGRPKGVVLSHRNLVAGAESVSTYLDHTSEDVILSVLPLSFDAGLSQVTTAFVVGAHCILINYLLPRDVVNACGRHAVTALTCVPPLWMQLTEASWPPAVAERLRYIANTGGRLPRVTLDKLRGIFANAAPFLMYGLTEAFRSTYLDPAEIDRRPESIGKAIPNAEILVLRPDGSTCSPGEEGELVHRGALVALGYWGDPVRSAERFRPFQRAGQSWRTTELVVWSGDTVIADADGFLYFVGRADEMIKTSGYRVSPTEIEEAAYSTGLVRDAVALGVPDPALGQRIVLVAAAVHADVDASEIAAALRQRLPLYMVPVHIDLRDELHRSPNGKLDRSLIKLEVSR